MVEKHSTRREKNNQDKNYLLQFSLNDVMFFFLKQYEKHVFKWKLIWVGVNNGDASYI